MLEYAKFWVALLGAGVTSALTVVAPDTVEFKLLTVASAVVTAAGVYWAKNKTPYVGRHRTPEK